VGKGRKLEVLSIIKRGSALGLLAHSETEERFLRSRSEIVALVQIAFGGMVAEELFFGESGTGPSGDLDAATRLAASMVGSLGLGGSLISLDAAQGPPGANIVTKVLSSDRSRDAMEGILDLAKTQVSRMLDDNRHLVEALRDALLDRDELVADEITAVLAGAARVPGSDQRVLDLDLLARGPAAMADADAMDAWWAAAEGELTD